MLGLPWGLRQRWDGSCLPNRVCRLSGRTPGPGVGGVVSIAQET